MKKILFAAIAAGALALTGCSDPESGGSASSFGGSPTSTTSAQASIAASTPEPPAPKLSEQNRHKAFYSTIADEGIVVSDGTALMAGLATCQFLDEGGSLRDLMLGLAMSEEDPFDLGVSNDDLPFIMGAAVGAFCPEHSGAVA